MKIFNVAKAFFSQHERDERDEQQQAETESFKLASAGGFLTVLKVALFILFGYLNARLFVSLVPGWQGYGIAVFALLGEATAFYCLLNFVRSAGAHKIALGAFGAALTLFAVAHATVSFFGLEQGALHGVMNFYAHWVAFPLLFGLLLGAAIIIPLCHWRTQVAQARAASQVEIETNRAKLTTQKAVLKDRLDLEHAKLEFLNEQIKLGNQYNTALVRFAEMKNGEHQALASITNPEVRREVANALGITLPDVQATQPTQPATPKPVAVWRGNQQVSGNPIDWSQAKNV